MWILILFSLASCELSSRAEASRFEAPQSDLSALRNAAMFGETLVVQGEAISKLSASNNPGADGVLADVQAFGNVPELVRTWAMAARIQRTQSMNALADLAPLAARYPALQRPIRTKLLELPTGSTADMLKLAVEAPALQSSLLPSITQAGVESLAHAMLTHENTNSRQLAAGLLGGMAQNSRAVTDILSVYEFDRSAETVPWAGGALYVPALRWDRREARTLMGSLIEWYLFCDRHGLNQEKQQIFNNIRSVGLWRQAGSPSFPVEDTVGLLMQWKSVIGAEGIAEILHRQGVRYDTPYASVLQP